MTITSYPTLESLADSDHRGGSWWAAVARVLDELDERLTLDDITDAGPSGALADAVSRDPALANDAQRLIADHATLTERARRLRRYVAEVAGDEGASPAIADELAALAAAEDRYQHESRALFWDSFTRDMGGER